jgi:peptide/nickel transport system permease protein
MSDDVSTATLETKSHPTLPTFPRRKSARRTRFGDWRLLLCGGFVGLVVLVAIFGPLITPHDPNAPEPVLRLSPPAWEERGAWDHPLGTDPVGRDILSRLIAGTRPTLLIAATVVVLSGSIGLVVAVVAGYWGGLIGALLMRLTDAVISMPFLVFAVAIAAAVGPSLLNLILILAVLSWGAYARVIRAEVLRVRGFEYVTLARLAGVHDITIIRRHILPNVLNSVLVLASLQLGVMIIASASLDFLGLGVPPPDATWGGMLADGRLYISTAWWVVTVPGIAIGVLVLAVNILGEWLRDTLDPTGRVS